MSAGAVLSVGGVAHASVSILMTLDELVANASLIVVATATASESRWEELPTGKRIVTYTSLSVDEALMGSGRTDARVRTLGGIVGKIGQSVSGEAEFAIGEASLLFLSDRPEKDRTITMVTGAAQGHFPLREINGERVLLTSPDTGKLLPRKGPTISAREVLVGKPLPTARQELAIAVKRAGKPKNP